MLVTTSCPAGPTTYLPCPTCGKIGHIKEECWKTRRERELLNPPRFQEDDELYMEKAYNQRKAYNQKKAATWKNHTTYCPVTTGTAIKECHAPRAALRPQVLSGSSWSSVGPPPGLGCEISIGGVENEIKIVSG